jgi:hypothetical protein
MCFPHEGIGKHPERLTLQAGTLNPESNLLRRVSGSYLLLFPRCFPDGVANEDYGTINTDLGIGDRTE